MPRRSGQRLRHTAETTPIDMPITTDQAMLQTVSQNVGAKRSAISVATGRLVRSDRPKSPRSTPPAKRTNCSGSDLSSPRSCRTSSTVCGVASGPAASRAGSPGSRCTNMNRSEEHTSELQSLTNIVCRLLLEKKKKAHHTSRREAGGNPLNAKLHTSHKSRTRYAQRAHSHTTT